MDRNVIYAIGLCGLIFLLWQKYTAKQFPAATTAPQAISAHQGAVAPSGVAATPSAEKILASALRNGKDLPAQSLVELGDSDYRVTINTRGGAVSAIQFTKYKGRKAENLDALIGGTAQLELASPSQEWAYLSTARYSVKSSGKNAEGLDQVILSYDDSGVSIERAYVLYPNQFSLDHDFTIRFKKAPPAYVFLGLRALRNAPKIENERRSVMFNKAGGTEHWDPSDVSEAKEDLGEGKWAGVSSRYFLSALLDRGSVVRPQFQLRPLNEQEVAASLIYRLPGQSIQIPLRYYYGPKEVDTLKAAGKGLDAAVDFGWFTIFAYPLLKTLKWFYQYVHNFGIAIILLTVLVKVLTYPLTFKSMKSMKQMQKIQPQIQKLKERYKDDKEKLNREMMQMMKSSGYNPMSGCLPIFIQMPIFIALYNVLYGAIDLYGQPFFGWIGDLSAKDPFFVTPILLALMMFVQQKLTPTTGAGPMQRATMAMMPPISGSTLLCLPAGPPLSMLANSITSIIQQFFINRSLGITRAVA